MMNPAAFWNPAITGAGMNFTIRPRCAKPSSICIAPAIASINSSAEGSSNGSPACSAGQ